VPILLLLLPLDDTTNGDASVEATTGEVIMNDGRGLSTSRRRRIYASYHAMIIDRVDIVGFQIKVSFLVYVLLQIVTLV
jgi:hypothetical protein